MKISKLSLKNFKTFKNETFDFSKITILAGANSAGKSTILNALSAIAQNNNAQHFPLKFHNYGENIHLGGFKDIIHSDANYKTETFSLKVDLEDTKNTYSFSGEYKYDEKTAQIQLLSLFASLEEFKIQIERNGSQYRIFKDYRRKNAPKINEDFLVQILEVITADLSKDLKVELKSQKSKTKSHDLFSDNDRSKLVQHVLKIQSAISRLQNLTIPENENINIQNIPEEYKK